MEIKAGRVTIRELTPPQLEKKGPLLGFASRQIEQLGQENDPRYLPNYFENIALRWRSANAGDEPEFSLFEIGRMVAGLPEDKIKLGLGVFENSLATNNYLEIKDHVNNYLVASGRQPVIVDEGFSRSEPTPLDLRPTTAPAPARDAWLDDPEPPVTEEVPTGTRELTEEEEGKLAELEDAIGELEAQKARGVTEVDLGLGESMEELGERVQALFRENPPTDPDMEGDTVDEFWGKVNILRQEGVTYTLVKVSPPSYIGLNTTKNYEREIFDKSNRHIGSWGQTARITKDVRAGEAPYLDLIVEQVGSQEGDMRVYVFLDRDKRIMAIRRKQNIDGSLEESNTQQLNYEYKENGEISKITLEDFEPGRSKPIGEARVVYSAPEPKPAAVGAATVAPAGPEPAPSRDEELIEGEDFRSLLDQGAEKLKREGRFTVELSSEEVDQLMRQVLEQMEGEMDKAGKWIGIKEMEVKLGEREGELGGGVYASLSTSQKVGFAWAPGPNVDTNIELINKLDDKGEPTGRILTDQLFVDPESFLGIDIKGKVEKYVGGEKINDSFRKVLASQLNARGATLNEMDLEFIPGDKLKMLVRGGPV